MLKKAGANITRCMGTIRRYGKKNRLPMLNFNSCSAVLRLIKPASDSAKNAATPISKKLLSTLCKLNFVSKKIPYTK